MVPYSYLTRYARFIAVVAFAWLLVFSVGYSYSPPPGLVPLLVPTKNSRAASIDDAKPHRSRTSASSHKPSNVLIRAISRKTIIVHRPLRCLSTLRSADSESISPQSPTPTNGDIIDVESTRVALVRVIEQSWARVVKLIDTSTLALCEEDLKSATSLLVLATVRRSANENPVSSATVERMLREADVNSDGQLTFLEWYNWLGRGQQFEQKPMASSSVDDGTSSVFERRLVSHDASDPMVSALQIVLGQAICTMRVAARFSHHDPAMLTASFIAGGVMSGELDPEVARSMIARLPPATRELVSLALTMESATANPATRNRDRASVGLSSVGDDDDINDVLRAVISHDEDVRLEGPYIGSNMEQQVQSPMPMFDNGKAETGPLQGSTVIYTVDLSSVPILTAPSIVDDIPVTNSPNEIDGGSSNERREFGDIKEETSEGDQESLFDDSSPSFDVIQEEVDFLDNEDPDSKSNSEAQLTTPDMVAGLQTQTDDIATDEMKASLPSLPSSLDTLSSTSSSSGELAVVWKDISTLRRSLSDLDDPTSSNLRAMILSKGRGRQDVLGLAMALRSTRLQHATRLPRFLKQQLALETLQLWAPLSFQVGLSQQTPELEVHSYVLLFPRSFGSFIHWYGRVKPTAKTLLAKYRSELELRLRDDDLMPRLAAKVVIQSRMKTPSSAFKKLVKDAKDKDELFDLIGLRVIVHENQISAPFESTRQEQALAEEASIWRAFSIANSIDGWTMEPTRLKDYVSHPKASGYQSLHATFVHDHLGIHLELQIRSKRMHWEAEYGLASHNNYKALTLPPSVDKKKP